MTVCLNMIVRNEAHVIRRCLDSVRPYIDSWCIVDTGSTDGTQQIILDALADLPGALYEREWVNFAHNRNEALDLVPVMVNEIAGAEAAMPDWLLQIDADETLTLPYKHPDRLAPYLSRQEDGLYVPLQLGDQRLTRLAFIRPGKWRWAGVLHEILVGDGVTSILRNALMVSHADSARNATPALKYFQDAQVLTRELEADPTNLRNLFYLAQSYRDCGLNPQAIDTYRRRVAAGGWPEEAWYSQLQIAVLLERSGAPGPEVIAAYLAAHEMRPTRCEAFYGLARYLRLQRSYETAYHFALAASAIRMPADTLFVDENTYQWRVMDELAVSAYFTGRYTESAAWCLRIANRIVQNRVDVPAADRARIATNWQSALNAAVPMSPEEAQLRWADTIRASNAWALLPSVAVPPTITP